MEKLNGYLVQLYKDTNVYSLTYGNEKTITTYDPIQCPPDQEKKEQIITWVQEINTLTVGNSIELIASSSSGLPVTFDVIVGDSYAHIENNVLYADKEGTILLTCSQSGDEDYYPAVGLQRTISIVNGENSILTASLSDGGETYTTDGETLSDGTEISSEGTSLVQNGYITKRYIDTNPNSPTYGKEKTITYEDLEHCIKGVAPAEWTEISREPQMVTYYPSGVEGYNGCAIVKYEDTNEESPTYGEIRTVIEADSSYPKPNTDSNYELISYYCQSDIYSDVTPIPDEDIENLFH